MACRKSHHLPCDYSLFPPVLILITAVLITVCFVVLLPVLFPAVAVMPLAAKVLKRVMVNTGGNKRQVPAKRQNRGSRNSTGDGG